MKRQLLIGALLAAVPLLAADAKNADGAAAAFAQLKKLVGTWEADTSMGKARSIYELTAGGTVLVEREEIGGKHAMMTMISVDGDRVVLTHYCMAGNQPRMAASGIGPSGEIAFRFLDATGLKSDKDGHMRHATFKMLDADHFESNWQFFQNGKPAEHEETFRYTRTK